MHMSKQKGMYYLIRVKDISSTGILRSITLPETAEFDVLKSITLTKKQTNEVKADKEKLQIHTSNVYF